METDINLLTGSKVTSEHFHTQSKSPSAETLTERRNQKEKREPSRRTRESTNN